MTHSHPLRPYLILLVNTLTTAAWLFMCVTLTRHVLIPFGLTAREQFLADGLPLIGRITAVAAPLLGLCLALLGILAFLKSVLTFTETITPSPSSPSRRTQ